MKQYPNIFEHHWDAYDSKETYQGNKDLRLKISSFLHPHRSNKKGINKTTKAGKKDKEGK